MSDLRTRPWRRALALCGLVVALDQASKAIVEANLVLGEEADLIGPLTLTNVHNSGIAFGLSEGQGAGLIALTVAALALILVLFARDGSRPGMWVAIGLLTGGALGNLADRIRVDAVTDFIDLPAWPPFNLADVAITAGVATLAWIYLREERR